MFADPFSITYNAVSKDLVKVNQDFNGSEFYLDDGQQKFHLSVKHTIPARGQSGESHLFRLDVEPYDTDGVYLRTDSAWGSSKTFDAPQVTAAADLALDALISGLTAANIAKLVGREV